MQYALLSYKETSNYLVRQMRKPVRGTYWEYIAANGYNGIWHKVNKDRWADKYEIRIEDTVERLISEDNRSWKLTLLQDEDVFLYML